MVLYIADPHFGHANIIRMCNRPFKSVEDMDKYIIMSWNRKVKADDTVYVVGDFAWRNEKPASYYLSRLNGMKVLVKGNHDDLTKTDPMWLYVTKMDHVSYNGKHLCLCHYPLMTWPGAKLQGKEDSGSYMVYGHIHNNTNLPFWNIIKNEPMMLNAGVEVNGYEPVTLEEMIQNNKKFKTSVV